MRARLQEDAIAEGLMKLNGWEMRAGSLYRKFTFTNFEEAFAFMKKVAHEAENLNHHPDWRNVYNNVEISLSTHDAGGITSLDLRLAEIIDKIA